MEGRSTTLLACDRCAERIGVYEPMVFVVGGEARETSRAAEPDLASQPGLRYHRACYLSPQSVSSPAGEP